MNYLTIDKEGIKCAHPKVEKIWRWGGGALVPNAKFLDCISVITVDGVKEDFVSENLDNTVMMAEKYLNEL